MCFISKSDDFYLFLIVMTTLPEVGVAMVHQSFLKSIFKINLFYVYEYTVVILMTVSHNVVDGNLNSGLLLTPVGPCSYYYI